MVYRTIFTTTRRPSPRTRSLLKDLVDIIPRAIRLTRGHMSMEELWVEARSREAQRVAVIASRKGNPSLIRFYNVGVSELEHIASLRINGVSLAREYGAPSPSGASKRASTMLVYLDSEDEVPASVAEILVTALGAAVALRPEAGPESVVAVVASSRKSEGEASLYFLHAGKQVGPRLRVSPTRGAAGSAGSN